MPGRRRASMAETEPVQWLLAEHLGDDPDRILLADPAALVRARGYLAEWRPSLLDRLEHLPDAFAASGAGEQLAAALEPVVELAGGGRLIIQATAALTAIDVDGGGRRPLEVDLEAAAEIARQLRLRRLGGTIVVDFVDLAAKRDRARLLATLRAALADDPAPVRVWPMSPLGLVELSRKRSGPSLAEQLGRSCPCCAGSGLLPGVRRRSEELMRDLAGRPPGRVSAAVAPDLHAYLTGAAATAWKTFAERQGRAPALQVDASLGPGGYRIEEAGAMSKRGKEAEPTGKGPRCPICGRPRVHEFRPFCSARCRNVDLSRWFGEVYTVPAVEPGYDEDDEGPEEGGASR